MDSANPVALDKNVRPDVDFASRADKNVRAPDTGIGSANHGGIGSMTDNTRHSSGAEGFGQNPFDALTTQGLPAGPSTPPNERPEPPRKTRGRVDILRQKAGRGGKTVTVVANFVGIGLPEKELLAKKMRNACGTGGTVKEGRIEIQGDKRNEVARILTEAGFRPVFAGG